MLWLVTGGAGYIGSHVSRALIAAGHDIVVIDNLLNGNKSRVPSKAQFIEADIRDGDALLDAMQGIDGVIHLAGLKSVNESIKKPLAYYDTNVNGTLSVLRAMSYRNIGKLVFSSTASLYAVSDMPIPETGDIELSSPYAASKFMAERLIADFAANKPFHYTILRYFNVAGANSPDLMDNSQDNLLPRLTRAIQNNKAPEIFGDDYATRDGSCIRDYVHVADIANAHVLAGEKLGQLKHNVYNVGTGNGVTVFDVGPPGPESAQRNLNVSAMHLAAAASPPRPPAVLHVDQRATVHAVRLLAVVNA